MYSDDVYSVVITNRGDCCGELLGGLVTCILMTCILMTCNSFVITGTPTEKIVAVSCDCPDDVLYLDDAFSDDVYSVVITNRGDCCGELWV